MTRHWPAPNGSSPSCSPASTATPTAGSWPPTPPGGYCAGYATPPNAPRTARPRTYTRHARLQITTATRFLDWLAARRTHLRDATQTDLDDWLTSSGPSAHAVRDFLGWAREHRHCSRFIVPTPGRHPGPAITDEQRWALLARLLHDDDLELTDRVGGALLLLYGQQLSRITALTTEQLHRRGEQVFLRPGRDEITVPEPLAGLLTALARDGRRYIGVGTPPGGRWLFPGHLPGRPLTAARLGERLRTLGIHAQPSVGRHVG